MASHQCKSIGVAMTSPILMGRSNNRIKPEQERAADQLRNGRLKAYGDRLPSLPYLTSSID
jgi:hypothetical protein